jgi:DNA-3-methyladenine glycosylase I
VNPQNELYVEYHDSEWGVPVHDDNKHFEMLILEGAQAGLSWETVLKKRENYRKAYKAFDPKKAAKYDEHDIERLLQDEGIIRNRLKIKSSIKNAQVFLEIQKEYGSFDKYIWKFVGNAPVNKKYKRIEDLPTKTEISDKISKDLKKRGMSFVGSTIIYSYMQAVGLENAHTIDCFRHRLAKECAKLAPAFEKTMADEGLAEDLRKWPKC